MKEIQISKAISYQENESSDNEEEGTSSAFHLLLSFSMKEEKDHPYLGRLSPMKVKKRKNKKKCICTV